MRNALLAVLLLTTASVLRGDDTPPRVVRITATVVDRTGKPVTGLKLTDFALFDQGVSQALQTVEPRRAEPRRLAILLDEFHVDPSDTERVRAALTAFVNEQIRSEDMVVVLKPLDSLPSIELSNDRDAMKRAIGSFDGRKGVYTPRTPLEEEAIGRAPALAERARAQVVLSALRALAARLGAVAGRSAILVVSEGFAPPSEALAARTLPDAGIVERFANRYDVPVYAFDPRVAASVEASVLTTLTEQTGGTMNTGTDLAAALRQVAGELDSGYLLTFRPSESADGKFHEVRVQTVRAGTRVRVRAGYVSPLPPEARRAFRPTLPMLDTSRPLRRSPLIDVWTGVTRASDAHARVVVTWEPDRENAVAARAVSRVTLKATSGDGTVLFNGALEPIRGVGLGGGSPDRAEFDAAAGRVQLDMSVLDERGTQIDTDIRDFEVPELKPRATLLLPPVVVTTRSAREFRNASAEMDASPNPSREFRRTDRLLIRVPVLSASATPPHVSAQLLNRRGQKMMDLAAIPGDVGVGVSQFDLPLAALAPGDYYLQFTATADTGATEQRVSFRIVG